jgi:hypothetical protein
VARFVSGSVRELAAAVVLAAVAAQTVRVNPVPPSLTAIPQGTVLTAVVSWPRMLGRWDLLAPEPPRENDAVVVDAQTREGNPIDPLTGLPPEVDLGARGRLGMGPLWSDYLDRLRRPEWSDMQRAFRDYVAKGGPKRQGQTSPIVGLDAYWVAKPIPAPGQAPGAPDEASGKREKLFSHSRGGPGRSMDKVPLVRPPPRK